MSAPCTITDDELKLLESCQSSADWANACDTIKAAHGDYPSDWWPRVKLSGMMDRILARWGSDSQIRVTAF